MSSRAELNVRARNIGIDPATYPNDSKLEQRVIYEEKNNQTAAGTLATGVLTSDATNNSDAETVTIGDRVYTWKTTLTEVLASGILTSTGVTPTDGDQISVGSITYTFKTALSTTPTKAYEVLIGGSAAVALDNLKLAINQGGTNFPTAADNSGVGTTWSTGTVRHPDVNATTNSNTQQTIIANVPGVKGNLVTTTSAAVTLSWAAANATGGVDPVQDQIKIGASADTSLKYLKDAINGTAVTGGPGVGYSTGTKVHLDVTATTNTATAQTVQAISYNSGNTIVTTETGAHTSWGAGTLTGGVAKEVAQAALDNAALSGGARV